MVGTTTRRPVERPDPGHGNGMACSSGATAADVRSARHVRLVGEHPTDAVPGSDAVGNRSLAASRADAGVEPATNRRPDPSTVERSDGPSPHNSARSVDPTHANDAQLSRASRVDAVAPNKTTRPIRCRGSASRAEWLPSLPLRRRAGRPASCCRRRAVQAADRVRDSNGQPRPCREDRTSDAHSRPQIQATTPSSSPVGHTPAGRAFGEAAPRGRGNGRGRSEEGAPELRAAQRRGRTSPGQRDPYRDKLDQVPKSRDPLRWGDEQR